MNLPCIWITSGLRVKAYFLCQGGPPRSSGLWRGVVRRGLGGVKQRPGLETAFAQCLCP